MKRIFKISSHKYPNFKAILSKLTHFSRANSAQTFFKILNSLLLIVFVGFIVINLSTDLFGGQDSEKRLRSDILTNPLGSIAHQKLGQYYLSINAQAAEREYALAEELYKQKVEYNDKIAGIESSPWQTWLNLKTQKEQIGQQIKYWETVHSTLPEYQYAILKLAIYYYQLGDKTRGKEYLETLLAKNPTNQTALKVSLKLNDLN